MSSVGILAYGSLVKEPGKEIVPLIRERRESVAERLSNFEGIDVVLYTKFGANITDLGAEKLADLAIKSAKAKAGRTGNDGISYLISVKQQGVSTPLMPGYENEILQKTVASSLEDALSRCLDG